MYIYQLIIGYVRGREFFEVMIMNLMLRYLLYLLTSSFRDLKLVEEIGRRLATMSHQLVYLNQSQSMIQEPWPTHYRNAGLIGQVILRFNNGTSGIDVKSSEGFEVGRLNI